MDFYVFHTSLKIVKVDYFLDNGFSLNMSTENTSSSEPFKQSISWAETAFPYPKENHNSKIRRAREKHTNKEENCLEPLRRGK